MAREVQGTHSGEGEQPQGPAESNGKSGLLEGTGVAETVADDPLFRFLQDNWRVLSVVIVAAALFYFARSVYLSKHESAMQSAADVFAVSRKEYTALLGVLEGIREAERAMAAKKAEDSEIPKESQDRLEGLQKEKSEVSTRLESNLKALSAEKPPYRQFALLYQGLLASTLGDSEKATEIFRSFDWKAYSASPSIEGLAAELAAINYARLLADKDGLSGAAEALLKELSGSAVFVHVSAALLYARLADTPQQQSQAATLLRNVQTRHPEQGELIEPELDKLDAIS